jgi:hypothetical protein
LAKTSTPLPSRCELCRVLRRECYDLKSRRLPQLPKKCVKDTIAFYYIWKKHGSCAKARDDGNLSDDFLPEPEPGVSIETLKLMDRLRSTCLSSSHARTCGVFEGGSILIACACYHTTQSGSYTFKITLTLLGPCMLRSQPMHLTTRGKRSPNLACSVSPVFSKASKGSHHYVFHRS